MTTISITLTDALSARVEARRLPVSPIPPLVPPSEVEEVDGADLGYAEGQSFAIEYVNDKGERSTRPITVLKIKSSAHGVPCLYAKCHVRRRAISFRVDRIVAIIDFDGEVFDDVPVFLFDNFGMATSVATRTVTREDSRNWNEFRQFHGAHIVLLTAVSHADTHMVPCEVDEIVQFCAEEAERMGIEATEAFCRLAAAFIRRLRPQAEHVVNAVDILQAEDPKMIVRVLSAAARVIDADGIRHPEETALLNAAAQDLIGIDII